MEKIEIIETKDIPKISTLTCQRCGDTWQNRVENPKRCPSCHSPYWNKPRRKPK